MIEGELSLRAQDVGDYPSTRTDVLMLVHPMLRAAAEWNLENRPPATRPATRPGRHGDER